MKPHWDGPKFIAKAMYLEKKRKQLTIWIGRSSLEMEIGSCNQEANWMWKHILSFFQYTFCMKSKQIAVRTKGEEMLTDKSFMYNP